MRRAQNGVARDFSISFAVRGAASDCTTSLQRYAILLLLYQTRWDLRNKRGSRVFRILFVCLIPSAAMALSAGAENAPGVTDREIKIGQTMPYTGPAARFSAPGLAEMAYMKMINDQGGINGRKITLISVDDGYTPWRTGNETRKLIEVEKVALIFGSIGTPLSSQSASICNDRRFRSCSSTVGLIVRH